MMRCGPRFKRSSPPVPAITGAEPTRPSRACFAGLLVDAHGERLTPSHAVKKDRRYRYYISATRVPEAAEDPIQSWRLPAQEIEDCVISVLIDALTNPAKLIDRLDIPDLPSHQMRRMLGRAARFAATLGNSHRDRAKVIRGLVEQVIVDEERIVVAMRRSALSDGEVPLQPSDPSGGAIELTAAVEFKRRGAALKLVLPGVASHRNMHSKCDPVLVKAIARGHAWFDELASGRVRSLHELAVRDGITRRYIRRLVDLAFLSPQLVETILQGRQADALTASRLTELDLPLDWAEQHRLLAS